VTCVSCLHSVTVIQISGPQLVWIHSLVRTERVKQAEMKVRLPAGTCVYLLAYLWNAPKAFGCILHGTHSPPVVLGDHALASGVCAVEQGLTIRNRPGMPESDSLHVIYTVSRPPTDKI
jgi:hypothetical protein